MKRLFVLFLLFAVQGISAEKPHIVLVMADDQGWGDMAYNGHPVLKTPNFDQMAVGPHSVRFDHFYAAAPVCSPTRASVLTGRHPNRSAVYKWGHHLRPQEVTIAEALKEVGYRSGHFGKWHLGSVRKGSPVTPGAQGFDEWLSAENFYDNDPILSREGKATPVPGESSVLAVDAALEFLKKNATDEQPTLTVVWFGSPHSPHEAAAEDKAHYADQPVKKQDWLGEITGMDRAVGKLRAGLAEQGLTDNTLFWYCSDNGGLYPESTGGRRKKGSVYEGGLRVPSIIEWPAVVSKNRIVKTAGNTSDIFPTLLTLTGAKAPSRPIDGISLLDTIRGETDPGAPRPQAMGFWDYSENGIGTPSKQWMEELLAAQKAGTEANYAPERLRLDADEIPEPKHGDELVGHAAWIAGDWKLHRIRKKSEDKEVWELYNLAADRMEEKDLASSETERVEKMKAALEAWQQSVLGSMKGADY